MKTIHNLQTIAALQISSGLNPEEQVHLNGFWMKLKLISDRVMTVALGFQNGMYLVGPPGVSKTWTVVTTLEKLSVPYTLLNNKITAPGLRHHLMEHPDHVAVVDDVGSVTAEKPSQQLLLAALGGKPGEPRRIHHTTAEVDGRQSFEYRGSIIAISNVPLKRDPLADAIASRVPILEHQPTDEEVAAYMKYVASQGYKDLTCEQCVEVAEFVIEESRACDYRMDLRHLSKGLGDRRFWQFHPDHTH